MMSEAKAGEHQIAILMATYNGENYIAEMLDSLLAQTYASFVCYIHDDGSSDGTCRIVDAYVGKEPERMRWLRGAPQGSAKGNFLWMLSQIEADYYMLADQDDVWLPDKIEKTWKKMRDKGADLVFTDMYVTDRNLGVLSDSMIAQIGRRIDRTGYAQVMIDNPAAGCTMLFTKEVRDLAIQIRHLDAVEMHDQWILTLAALTGDVAAVDEPLVYYRQHGRNEMGAGGNRMVDRIVRLGKEIVTGSLVREKKEFTAGPRRLAEELLLVEGIPEERRKVLKELAEIKNQPKARRIRFYRDHGFGRAGRIRTWWMWLWV